jgi:uncharacterized damage-inducible protein DinB
MGKLQEVVQLDLQYSVWATSTLLQSCAQLSIVNQNRDLGVSHGTILGTLYHFHISERFWSKCLLANRIPPLHHIAPEPVPSKIQLEAVAEGCQQVSRAFADWFQSTSEDELAQPLSCQISDAVVFPYVRWQLIRHVVNHSSNHRGQIVGMIRALGKQPPNLDVMTYLLQQPTLT